MSKITFRADDDLIARIEAMDASKSEIMRQALRAYFGAPGDDPAPETGSLDALVTDLIDQRIDERLTPDVNVTVTVEDDRVHATDESTHVPEQTRRKQQPTDANTRENHCQQCGETVDPDHVYCPNCGEKSVNRVFCDCGDELRTDWAFCPGCGRRTPAADVLDP